MARALASLAQSVVQSLQCVRCSFELVRSSAQAAAAHSVRKTPAIASTVPGPEVSGSAAADAPVAAAPPVTVAVAAVAPVRTTLLTAPAIKREMEMATTRAAERGAVLPEWFRARLVVGGRSHVHLGAS